MMNRSVKGHEGIVSLSYNTVSKSVLILFEPELVKEEEIIIRVALSLSRDYDLTPVRILSKPQTKEMSNFAFVSGVLLLAALTYRIVNRSTVSNNALTWIAGLGTVGAAMEHAWYEIQNRGNFDPEALSVVYLLTALPKGNFLPAALFTWFTTFGRHLLKPAATNLELTAVEKKSSGLDLPHYEVEISPDRSTSDRMVLFRVLPSIVVNALTRGRAFSEGNLLSQIRDLQKRHGETLEGLGELRKGIKLRIR
jgi:hypothetical protein